MSDLPPHAQKYLDRLPTLMSVGGFTFLKPTLKVVKYNAHNNYLYLAAPVLFIPTPSLPSLKSEYGSRVDYEFDDACTIVYIRVEFTTAKPTYSQYDPVCRIDGHVDHNDPEQFFYADADRYER